MRDESCRRVFLFKRIMSIIQGRYSDKNQFYLAVIADIFREIVGSTKFFRAPPQYKKCHIMGRAHRQVSTSWKWDKELERGEKR